MNAAQIRCPGCDRSFNPRGLAHHISKSRDSRCHAFNTVSQTQSISVSIPQTAFSPALASIHSSPLLGDDGPDLEAQPDAGKFAATCVAARHEIFRRTLESHRYLADDDIPGSDGNTDESQDPTDVVDADVYEELVLSMDPFPTVIHDRAILDGLPDVPQGPEEPANQTEAGDLETTSMVIVDQFPLSSAGAPIPGMARGSSAQESHQDMHAASVWAPFNSQRDWLFAYWAKVHGPTSSAVTRLLEIPEVCVSYLNYTNMPLINA